MLNSRNYVLDKEVLNTGEQIAPDFDKNDPNLKTYYHQVPGARTHMPDGAEIIFRGGQFSTANKDVQTFLDKIADRQGSMVYTKPIKGINKEVALAAEEAARPAAEAGKVLDGQGVTEVSPEVKIAVENNAKSVGRAPAVTGR